MRNWIIAAFMIAALAGCASTYILIVEKRLNFDVILEGERTEG